MSNAAVKDDSAVGGRGSGRASLAVPAVMALFTILTAIGTARIQLPEEADFPGPKFFPWILVAAGAVLTLLLAISSWREGDPEAEGNSHPTYTDWRAVGWAVGGFAAFAGLLEVLGWVIAAALLFWCVTRAFGSKRPLFDVSVALLASSAIYLVFAVGLNVPLPSGILGGL